MKRLNAALAWNRAYHLSSRGRHEQALAVLRKVKVDRSMRWFWDVFVLLQLSLLERHEEVVEAARRYLESTPTGASADCTYMIEFAKWCGRNSHREYFAGDIPSTFDEAFEALDLRKVSPRWKRTFQLISHPKWGDA